jgi:hypothetical protein
VFAELLGHQSLKMMMRYAHLSPAFLTAEVSLLDSPAPKTAGTRGDQQKERLTQVVHLVGSSRV